MPGIGETLRSERRRQGRTLADAAAETRVRESYLAAIEEDDFDVLGGDVYARGFIKLYGRYLGLDADALVAEYRQNHERPEEITAIPGATFDDFVPAPSAGPRRLLTQPVIAAVAVVGVVAVLFILFRGGGDTPEDEVDPNAPGPAPAESEEDPLAGATDPLAGLDGTEAPAGPTATAAPAGTDAPGGTDAPAGTGEPLTDLSIVVEAIDQVRLTVVRGQPIASGALLEPGESRTLTDPAGEQVVFTVDDVGAATITVNDRPLATTGFAGQAMQISCTVGDSECIAERL
ncbi:helix-turn-helix domain-containing protein [Euzebya sp.]|uniref:helix-turn-helix domain-containing protein n=1 Tax=Euzebya sp. TaxID=1971409 RepID=UPI003513660D